MMHLHGFGLSGRYLLPTAEALADEFHTLVPDLPGFGRSGNAIEPLTVEELAHAAAAFLDTQGIEKVTLVGNSMGCPVICEFGYSYPDRLERAILVSPAGGINNQPLPRAGTPAQPRRNPRTGPVVERGISGLRAVRCPQHLSDVPGAHPISVTGPAAGLGRADAGRCRESRSIDAGSIAHPRSRGTDRAPRGFRRHRRSGSCDQLLAPGRAVQRHPTVHGRSAHRG